jgi:hypothetical protein
MSLAQIATRTPSEAIEYAAALPMPWLPPVINATFLSKPSSIGQAPVIHLSLVTETFLYQNFNN